MREPLLFRRDDFALRVVEIWEGELDRLGVCQTLMACILVVCLPGLL